MAPGLARGNRPARNMIAYLAAGDTGPSTPGASPTYQQGGAPQMYRIVEDSSERQLRPGREDFDKSSWTWDRNKLQ